MLTLDLNLASDAQMGACGLSRADFEALQPKAQAAHQALTEGRRAGAIAFMDLPFDAVAAKAAKDLARELAGFENLMVLGIGGSSLGAKALFSALCHPFHNLLPASKRSGMRLFFPDNSDPVTFSALLEAIDLGRTAVAAITKSGGTAETWAQILVLKERLGSEAAKRQLVAVTDPEKGALRAVAKAQGWRTLPVPPAVGGRFSVLTGVGLLPAAAAGVDVDALLEGSGAMARRCETSELFENPGYLLGAALYLMDVKRGRRIHVFMPYADALRETADWFVQLWAESLGKRTAAGPVGPTPIRAVGATDQHSLLQLLMEGPDDKVTIFVALDRPGIDLTIPRDFPDQPDVAYLGGHTFHALLSAERCATAAALAQSGRPSLTVRLPRLDAKGMGELLMLLEVATAFAGPLYGVNPYDQPGVEAGKGFTCGLLGRPGYEASKAELERRAPARPEWIV